MLGAACHGGIFRPARVARVALPLALAALGTLACGGEPPPRYQVLLRSLAVDAEPGEPMTCPGPEPETVASEPRGVVQNHSRREAVLTCGGVELRVDLELPARSVLDLAIAAGTEPGVAGRATAVVELRQDGASQVLLEAPVQAGPWAEHRIEVPADGAASLVLRSSGGVPVAWTGLRLAPADDAAAHPAERTSLILVSLDTVRADHLSLYGYERPTSPRLAGLGEESLVFGRAFSSSTWTLPSTATLLSGLLPSQHGALHPSRRLPEAVETVPERLREAGYRTVALTDGGFAGLPFGLAQGFERYDTTAGEAWQPRSKDAARTFNEAAAWVLHNHGHEPFFLFLHTYEAHQPYLNREGFADPYLAPEDRGEDVSTMIDPHHPERTPEELARLVALYDGEIARTDHYLGSFLDTLERAGLADRIAIVVTSDHGEEFLEHGDLEHAFAKVFDPNVRVPLVVKLPAGRGPAGGRRVDVPVSGIDVAPTLLDLAGLPHDDLPGRSLLAIAAEGARAADRPVLVHGVPSFPNRSTERFRLAGAGTDPVLERPSADQETTLLGYDPASGEVASWDPGAPQPVHRLAALVAWARAGSLFARLPDDARRLAVPAGSRVRPRAVWTGESWVRLGGRPPALPPGGAGFDLAARGPHLLVFDLAQAGGPWSQPWGLLLARGDGTELQPYRLVAERRPPWSPFTDPLPPPGAVLPTAPLQTAAAATLDDATTRELKALGYLQ